MGIIIPGLSIFIIAFARYNYASPPHPEIPTNAEDTLLGSHGVPVFTAILFRHGDRNPVSTYPTNPHTEYFENAGMRDLTMKGKSRVYYLGRWVRERYESLIGDRPYNSNVLHVYSSDLDRTIASAQLFMAGFYPPTSTEKEIWNSNIPWQPIPVHTIPKPNDRMLLLKEDCPRFTLEAERIRNDPRLVEFSQNHKEMFEYLEEHAQISIPKDDILQAVEVVTRLYDTLKITKQNDLALPEWANKIYPQPIQDVAVMYFKIHTYNYEMKRLKGGPLLGHVIDELRSKRNDPQSEKLFQFYSGHDSTIVALLDALGVYDGKIVSYAAAVMFDLRMLNGEYLVTVSYRNEDDAAPILLRIPGCDNPCTLESFIGITQPLIPENWENECKYLVPDYNTILF